MRLAHISIAGRGETDRFLAAVAEALGTGGSDVQVVASAQPGVEILAVRPSWVRVSSADGTVLFEKILTRASGGPFLPLKNRPCCGPGIRVRFILR